MLTGGWPRNRLSEIGRSILFLGMAAAAITLLGAEHRDAGRIGSVLGSEAEEVTLGRMISDVVSGVDPLRAPGGDRAVDMPQSVPGTDEAAGEPNTGEPATARLRDLASRLAAQQRREPTRVGGRVVPPVDPNGDGPTGLPPADEGRDPGGPGSTSARGSTTSPTRSGPGTDPVGPTVTSTSTSTTAASGPLPGPTTVVATTTTVLTASTTSPSSTPTTTMVTALPTTTTTDDGDVTACQLDVLRKANMREQPSPSATRIGMAPIAVYHVVARQGDWYRISADGALGWVKSGPKQVPIGDC